ncbi:G4 quadruplex nucleic acid binding protein [Salix suchowensis]|nr:G4 quadruplex nucleic acid binding protein [Salix suchowensis]
MFLTRSGFPADGSAGVELTVTTTDVHSQQLLNRSGCALYGALYPNIVSTYHRWFMCTFSHYCRPVQARTREILLNTCLDTLFRSHSVTSSRPTSCWKISPDFAPVSFDFDSAPKPERKAELQRRKESDPVAAEANPLRLRRLQQPSVFICPPEQGKQQKKEKKEKKKDAGSESAKKGAAAEPADAGEPQIDLGEDTGPRTVVSGLVNYIPIEEMRTELGYGLCVRPYSLFHHSRAPAHNIYVGTSKEGKEGGIEIVQPPANAKVGDRVYFEGAEFEVNRISPYTNLLLKALSSARRFPLSQLNPKKKIFELYNQVCNLSHQRCAANRSVPVNRLHDSGYKGGGLGGSYYQECT